MLRIDPMHQCIECKHGSLIVNVTESILYVVFIVPYAPPTSVSGSNTSSSSLRVRWGPIPSDHQNGIITQYHILYRQDQSNNGSNATWSHSVTSSKSSADIAGLMAYTFYEIRVAGATSVGIGNYSKSILVQTDASGKFNP